MHTFYPFAAQKVWFEWLQRLNFNWNVITQQPKKKWTCSFMLVIVWCVMCDIWSIWLKNVVTVCLFLVWGVMSFEWLVRRLPKGTSLSKSKCQMNTYFFNSSLKSSRLLFFFTSFFPKFCDKKGENGTPLKDIQIIIWINLMPWYQPFSDNEICKKFYQFSKIRGPQKRLIPLLFWKKI